MRNRTISTFFESASENTNRNMHTCFEVVAENPQPKLILNSMDAGLDSAPIRYAVADTATRFKRLSPANTKTIIDSNQMYLSEETIQYETWRGRVLCVSEDHIEMEIRNDKFHEIKRTFRVSKRAVRNSGYAYVGNEAYVSFKKVRDYHGKIKEHTTIALKRPIDIPNKVKQLRIKEKMQRYAFMFKEDGND